LNEAASASGKQVDQRQLLQLLKTTLAEAPEVATLLPLVRNLKWSSNSEARANVSNGDESLGRDLQKKLITGGPSLPEKLSVQVTPFRNAISGPSTLIDLHLEPLLSEEKFLLSVDADELQHGLRDELERLAEIIATETSLPVLMGQP
jgi:hypothetical protein